MTGYQPHPNAIAYVNVYCKEIKPLIEKGKYLNAGFVLNRINALPLISGQGGFNEIIAKTHSVMSLFAHGKSLEAALHEEHPDTKKIERRMEFFEAYAAQLQIPGSDEE